MPMPATDRSKNRPKKSTKTGIGGKTRYDSCRMEGTEEVRMAKLLKRDTDRAFPIMVVGASERADDGVFWPPLRFERELFVRAV